MREVELLAIGAGPSNLGLAVALEELAPDVARNTLIVERNPVIEWQSGLLLPWAKSQVSFLKDLVTLRNPRSRFTFLNFLRSTDRIDEFINLGGLTPYRFEISAYLKWVAESLQLVQLRLGQSVDRIEPQRDRSGTITGWLTTMSDGDAVRSRYLVVGTGRDANIPAALAGLPSGRVVHSTRYRQSIAELDRHLPHRIALIGSSQSAAEMFHALRTDLAHSEVTWLMRSIGPTADPSSQFTNELYYPSAIDGFFNAPVAGRQLLRQEMYRTNYSCMTPAMLSTLYGDVYRDRLNQRTDRRLMPLTEVTGAVESDGEVILDLVDRRDGTSSSLACDLVVLGTGFNWQPPKLTQRLLDSLGVAELTVTRGYRLKLDQPATAVCYLQGVNESTHGISDSLLSVLAQRAGDITSDILAHHRTVGARHATDDADVPEQIASR